MNESPLMARRLRRVPSAKIAPGEPDIRNWLTLTEDGYRVGRVHDLLVDLASGHVRHLEIRLDPDLAQAAGTAQLVIPIEALQVSASRRHVHVLRTRRDELVHAPRFGARPVGAADERALRQFYQCDELRCDTARFWGPRRRGRERAPYARTGAI